MPGWVQFSSGHTLTDIIHALEDRGRDGATRAVVTALDGALIAAYMDTQARTHIITGSLKMSGRYNSDFDGSTWTGIITYGGPSLGPNNPVDYAIYEMARGGSHDFFSGIPGYEADFVEAMYPFFD